MALPSAIILLGDRASQPSAASVAAGTLYSVTDEDNIIERSNGASWDAYSPTGTGAGNVSAGGTLTADEIVLGAGGTAVATLGSLGTTTTVLHGNAAGAPTFGAVSLTADVSGDLPYANLAQGSALSVLGVTGNATADVASIAAGSDHQVLRRSGTAVAFGAVNLAQSAAVTGVLPVANGGTGSASGASILFGQTTLTNAQILALPTTGVDLVATPGANRAILPIWGLLNMDASAGAYANINADGFLFLQTSGNNLMSNYVANVTAPSRTYLSTLLGATRFCVPLMAYCDTLETDQWGNLANPFARANLENRSLQIKADNGGSGDFTGGNAANTCVVTVLYIDLGV